MLDLTESAARYMLARAERRYAQDGWEGYFRHCELFFELALTGDRNALETLYEEIERGELGEPPPDESWFAELHRFVRTCDITSTRCSSRSLSSGTARAVTGRSS